MKRLLAKLGIGPNPFKGKPKFASYTLVEAVGYGGFGEIYKAISSKDIHTGRFVALKMLHESLGSLEKHRFRREIGILKSLEHPNVVRIFEGGEENGVLFFTMEFLEGRNLKQVMEEKRQDLPTTAAVIKQAASGLQAAHDKGLIHRDVKPSNIFVCENTHIKVIDFGVATDPQATIKLTFQNFLPGSRPYMPPEVLPVLLREADEFETTPAYDQFALGAIAFEMLTQERPFIYDPAKPNQPHNFSSILFKKLKSVGDFGVEKAESLDPVLHRAMAPKPEERFASVLEFAEALEKVSGQMGS